MDVFAGVANEKGKKPRMLLTYGMLFLVGHQAGGGLSAEALEGQIADAAKRKDKVFTIPPGTYHLSRGDLPYAITFRAIKNMEIRGEGVTFLLVDPLQGAVNFQSCENVKLSGLTIRHEKVTFSQGTIEGVDAARGIYNVALADGYPSELRDHPVGYIFDSQTRQWKAGTQDLYFASYTRTDPSHVQLRLNAKGDQNVARGDFIVFRGRGHSTIAVTRSQGVSISGVTIQSSAGFGIAESEGEGGNHFQYRLTYGPKPDGATMAPLVSSSGDAFHSSNVRKGPTLEGCELEGMCDDGIAIHGSYAAVVKQEGKSVVVNTLWGALPLIPGDPVRLYNEDGALIDEAKVVGASKVDNFPMDRELSYRPMKGVRHFWRIELDKEIPSPFGTLLSTPNAEGSGFVVRNNQIRNNRARGILVKADNGLIEGNTVDGCTIAGIVAAPEKYFMEGDYCRNLIIRNNTISHTGYAMVSARTTQAGAISVTAGNFYGPSDGNDAFDGFGHRNIEIAGNTFRNVEGANLLVTNADGVNIHDNVFARAKVSAMRRGVNQGLRPEAIGFVRDSKNVTVSKNNRSDVQVGRNAGVRDSG